MTRFIFVLSFASLLLFAPPAFAAGSIGTVLEVEGQATVSSVPATLNMPVHLGDTVETGAGARVFILFDDNTELTLAENTSVHIDAYIYNPAQTAGNVAKYSILQGAFQYVSGLIGHGATVETPVGSIGMRGTEVWGGTLDNAYNVAVLDGKVAFSNEAGEELISKGESASVPDRHSRARRMRLSPERRKRMASAVHLKHAAALRGRINALRGKRQELRQERQGHQEQRQERRQMRQFQRRR